MDSCFEVIKRVACWRAAAHFGLKRSVFSPSFLRRAQRCLEYNVLCVFVCVVWLLYCSNYIVYLSRTIAVRVFVAPRVWGMPGMPWWLFLSSDKKRYSHTILTCRRFVWRLVFLSNMQMSCAEWSAGFGLGLWRLLSVWGWIICRFRL